MYEMYEPDPEDEYYDQLCKVAFSKMFREGLFVPSLEENYGDDLVFGFPELDGTGR